jgi:hypothetical protein
LSDIILEEKPDEQSDAEYVRGLSAPGFLKSLQRAVPQMHGALIQGHEKLQEQVITHNQFISLKIFICRNALTQLLLTPSFRQLKVASRLPMEEWMSIMRVLKA